MRKTLKSPPSWKKIALAVAATSLVLACVWGCAPQTQTAPLAESGDAEATVESPYPDFTERSAGLLPDTYTNRDMLNAGNRGCNTCHADLFDAMNSGNQETGYNHILTHTGFGKSGTYEDCMPCHQGHTQRTGPYLGDLLHGLHYSSNAFLDANGNCWSCHAVNSDGETDDYQFMLWDEMADSAALGGYVWAGDTKLVRDWAESRGFKGGYITEVATDSEAQANITLSQDVTPQEDVFIVNNWGDEVIDFAAACDPSNTVEVTGVKNPRSFSKEELQAMEQVDFVNHISCATNGPGGVLTSNVPMTGVPMSAIVEQCGGLEDGIDTVLVSAYDGWDCAAPFTAESYIDDAYIVTKMYGEDLTDDWGPIMVVSRGLCGAMNVKHAKTIEFSQTGQPLPPSMLGKTPRSFEIHRMNGAWFQNDGVTVKVGETTTLTGAAYSFYKVSGGIEQLSFSFDMGQTWTDFKIADTIKDYDAGQWINWSIDWTPQKAGTYIVKVDGIDGEGNHMENPVSLVVVVEE
ncbi:hypothetical protein ADLECEL_04400 [Adlercreutzia equolifaciens subsp. celatus]|nr:molybdopterin-dependent oxidoreductase [Adlercreutzia equolifaciens]MCP2077717.1 sulfoxide reductase catalytic subunit YedY [Adlercreutzia equolifaciens subsp. celatus DSM 18785]BCS56555.1 hypothetical protein ADLECEL_04400 [Adlercreutzia equolifaciens subsp. celatus]